MHALVHLCINQHTFELPIFTDSKNMTGGMVRATWPHGPFS